MSFRVLGLSPELFRPYFDMPDAELKRSGGLRLTADGTRMPCRVSLGLAPRGDEVLLINFEHQGGDTPYRARHAIYVSRSADKAFDAVDVVPLPILGSLVAVRAFDAGDMMIDADVVEGRQAAELFERQLADPRTSYLQVHYAKRGCYAARVERA
jgi:hypothetical protein